MSKTGLKGLRGLWEEILDPWVPGVWPRMGVIATRESNPQILRSSDPQATALVEGRGLRKVRVGYSLRGAQDTATLVRIRG